MPSALVQASDLVRIAAFRCCVTPTAGQPMLYGDPLSAIFGQQFK
jgi:hypothetical protein